MPDLTPNLNLEKPLDNETADIGVINSNMDKIDTGFGNIQQQIENIDVTGTQITVDQSQAPSLPGNGTIAQLFNWIANRIKAITGKTNWWDTPDITLASAKSHIDAAAPHSGHETPAGAQAKVDAHANATDPHPQYALDTDLNSHAALTSVHGATSTATANTIIMRDASGRAKVAAPSASDDIARKAEVDTKVSKSGDTMTGILTVPNLKAQINISSSSNPSAWPVGFVAGIVYNNGYPVNYGTIFSYKGTSGNSCVQILQAWPNTDGGEAYLYIRSSRDNGADVFGPWRKVWSENNDGAGSGLDADTLQGKVPSNFMSATKVYGSVTYTDSIAAYGTLTKNITLGGSYKHGMAVVSQNVVNTSFAGLVVFGTNNLKKKAVGYNYDTYSGSAACREFLGSVTTASKFGYDWTGDPYIRIDELYISGTNLVIVFYNQEASSRSLNCRIDWEVW